MDFDPGPGVDSRTAHSTHVDAYLTKLDSNGNFLWARTWGGTQDVRGLSVAVDDSGTAFVVGDFKGQSDFDPGTGIQLHRSHEKFDAYLNKIGPDGLW